MRKVLLGFLLLVVFAFAGLYAHAGRAGATAACTPPCVGYFNGGVTNSFPGDATNILSGGLNANDAGAFESILANYLNFGSYQNQIGAAFVIDQMLGQGSWAGRGGAAAGVGFARANFGTFQNLVNYYASSSNPGVYGVQWNDFRVGVDPNSAFFFDINDDAYHRYIPGVDDGPVIRFYWSGGEFVIQRVCGNLEGSIRGLPGNSPPTGSISVRCDPATGQQVATYTLSDPDGWTQGHISTATWSTFPPDQPTGGPYTVNIPQSATNPYVAVGVSLYVSDSGPAGSNTYQYVTGTVTDVPCVKLTCGNATITPSLIDPFTKFNITVTVLNNVNQPPPGATMTLNITPPPGAAYSFSGSQAAGGAGGVSTATWNNLGPTNQADEYTITWSMSGSGVSVSCPSAGQPAEKLSVAFLPYLSIFGGDAMVGSSPTFNGTASSCTAATTPNNNAGIYSWNNHSTDFSGAGAQYAVQALAQIEDFASAQNSSSTAPKDLSFANTVNVDMPNGLFGGGFGATSGDCDFTSDLTVAPALTDQTIAGTTVAQGTRMVRYVKDADVYISGNIVYANAGGSWAKVSDIPYFELVVVGGDIYIGHSVTELDGLYVAEPDIARGGGRIFDCAYGLRSQANLGTGNTYQDCNNRLVINGAFVAKQVQFLRTFGSLGQARATDTVSNNHSGEVFNFTPELWLPRAGASGNSGFTSITGLPPVL